MSNTGARWMIDPSAGVRLAPPRRYCTRCGVDKGKKSQTRGGLCRDCVATMPRADVRAWAA